MTVVDIFSNECDSRDADEVLLARMRQLSDPHTAQFKSFVQLILSIIKAKIQFRYEGCRQGNGVDDDELYDVAL